MKIDLSFWRFVIIVTFAKSLLWKKDGDVYFFHVGTITNGISTVFKVIILPMSIMTGFITTGDYENR